MRIFLLLGLTLVTLAAASTAGAAPGSKVGIYDEACTLYSDDTSGFDMLQELGVDTLRLNMYWDRVARTRPANAANHEDPAYDWSGYDRAAAARGRAKHRGAVLDHRHARVGERRQGREVRAHEVLGPPQLSRLPPPRAIRASSRRPASR